MKEHDEDEIDLGEYTDLHQVYDWLPYTTFRLQRILGELGCRMENIWQGYKANRREGYCEKYRIVRISDGKIINPCITRFTLQKFFASKDYPLLDEKSMSGKSKSRRNPEAKAFLKAVKELNVEKGKGGDEINETDERKRE